MWQGGSWSIINKLLAVSALHGQCFFARGRGKSGTKGTQGFPVGEMKGAAVGLASCRPYLSQAEEGEDDL